MAGSAENTLTEPDAFIAAGEAWWIEQTGVVAVLAAQTRDGSAAQQTLHEIEDALAALWACPASLWAVGPTGTGARA